VFFGPSAQIRAPGPQFRCESAASRDAIGQRENANRNANFQCD